MFQQFVSKAEKQKAQYFAWAHTHVHINKWDKNSTSVTYLRQSWWQISIYKILKHQNTPQIAWAISLEAQSLDRCKDIGELLCNWRLFFQVRKSCWNHKDLTNALRGISKTLTGNSVFCSFKQQLPRRQLSSRKGRNTILTIEKRLVRRRRWNWDGAPMTASSPPTMPCCSAKIFLQSFCKSFCFAHHQVFTCRTKLVMSNCQTDEAVRETHIKKEKQRQRYELQ